MLGLALLLACIGALVSTGHGYSPTGHRRNAPERLRCRRGAIPPPLLWSPSRPAGGIAMLLIIIVVALVIVGIAFVTYLVRAAIKANQLRLRLEPLLVSPVINFFDTLGIGSFAPTMAWMRFRRLVPDHRIPMTMLTGYTPSTFVQSLILLVLLGVGVDPVLLIGSVVAISLGAVVGVPLAVGSSVRTVQLVVAAALLLAATFYSLSNLGLMPVGGPP